MTLCIVILDPVATAGGIDCLRLSFRGMQYTESYELCAPEGCETISYRDLCLGERTFRRTQAREIGLYQFARSASDVILGTTHAIRGDELEDELDLYVQFLLLLHYPLPILCHVPHLVDEAGEKLSKSQDNAPRIVEKLREEGLCPAEARQWIMDNAYRSIKKPTPLHSFEGQLALLATTVRASGAQAKL